MRSRGSFASGSARPCYNPRAAVKRRLVNPLAALSLVVCMATVVLWLWSYARVDELRYRWRVRQAPHSISYNECGIGSALGVLGVGCRSINESAPNLIVSGLVPDGWDFSDEPSSREDLQPGDALSGVLTFGIHRDTNGFEVYFPHWAL